MSATFSGPSGHLAEGSWSAALRDQAARERLRARIGFWAVVASAVFNTVLCFFATQHWLTAGSGQIIACELAIMGAVLLAARHELSRGTLLAALLTIGTVVALKLFNRDIDLKIIHDLWIVVAFYAVGQAFTRRNADTLVTTLLCIVLALGLFELFAQDLFERLFDIWSFYVDKGALSASTVNYSNTRLFVSGERSDAAGRTLLPVLGNHRVSSVFLEPVSMGNFAILCLAWLLSVPMSARQRLWVLFGAVACAVLPDSRFSIGCCLAMLVLRVTGLQRSRVMVAVLPLLVVPALMVLGAHLAPPGPPRLRMDDLAGRLSFSGSLLNSWGWQQWLGLQASETYTADTGWAYVVANLGLPLAAGLWLCFAFLPLRTAAGQSMRGFLGLYMATSLCLGASVFSIKTAAFCWVLMGAASARRNPLTHVN